MSALEEHAFLQLLKKIEKEKYVPNIGERAILCRTINSTFNPVGLYFSAVGGVCGFLSMSCARGLYMRCLSSLMGSLYSFELSWSLYDHSPCSNFFNDIRSVEGQIGKKASEHYLLGNLNVYHRSIFRAAFDFLIFDRTSKWLCSVFLGSTDCLQWLSHYKMEWFDGLPIDPLTLWYWRYMLQGQTER
ncbi:uncharacterized protein TM35_000341080 [Trypanosoma theileri]|uniref:Uncharacterized protein n=1 Tax=Trypanosoma theileri TaxID=67003 RepID=A0A1X0NLB4_9TRYP|nr:uncharacterized protein TM35_000341080 [Trypanosoma theileri]ORC85496.1 hypothetical protein TM35_000341080 [Trypanosoma theileri]